MKPLISIFIGALSLAAVPAQAVIKEEWLTCKQDSECTSVELGCWYWQPVNKNFATQMWDANKPVCRRSQPAGPRPVDMCVHNKCTNRLNITEKHSHPKGGKDK